MRSRENAPRSKGVCACVCVCTAVGNSSTASRDIHITLVSCHVQWHERPGLPAVPDQVPVAAPLPPHLLSSLRSSDVSRTHAAVRRQRLIWIVPRSALSC